MKCRSRVPGQGVCLKSTSKTNTMQGFIILAIKGTEKLIVTEVDGRTYLPEVQYGLYPGIPHNICTPGLKQSGVLPTKGLIVSIPG